MPLEGAENARILAWRPSDGGKDVFVHITAVEAAGLRGLADGQKISFEEQADKRSGKMSAVNLKTS